MLVTDFFILNAAFIIWFGMTIDFDSSIKQERKRRTSFRPAL
jgi:hypothetical protein